MIFFWSIIASILCFNDIPIVNSHARDMLTSCSLSLSPGTYIMGKTSILSTSKYLNVVNETQHILIDGDFYTPNEILTISLSSVGGSQYVMETSNAAAAFGLLIDGAITTTSRYIGCSHHRVYDQSTVKLLTPHAGSGDVSVYVGWASGVGVVEVSNTITLKERMVPDTPTAAPVMTTDSVNNTSFASSSYDLAIGVSFGIAAMAILGCFVFYSYKQHESRNESDSRLLRSSSSSSSSTVAQSSSTINTYFTYEKKSTFLMVIIVALCIIFIFLMSSWTVPSKTMDGNDGYLGSPNWNNKISLHPSVLVNGFLFMQIVAILSWSLVTHDKSIAKLLHVLCQFIALITMTIGVMAIVRDKEENNEVSLASLHSWLGVCTITLFCFNFLIGCIMGGLKQYYPNSSLRTIIEWLFIHRTSGLVTLGFTVITIVTGITDMLSESTCASTNINSTQSNYSELPTACKLANGVGITVVFAVGAVCLLVLNRSYETQRLAVLSNSSNSGSNYSIQNHSIIINAKDAYYENDSSKKSYAGTGTVNNNSSGGNGLDDSDSSTTALVPSPSKAGNNNKHRHDANIATSKCNDDEDDNGEVVITL